jgi:hypothetical protein
MSKPLYLENDNNLFVDVDETLIFWKHINEKGFMYDETIEIKDPYMRPAGHFIRAVPNQRNISLLKRNKAQGRFIIVWSAGGSKWAREVVKTLGLNNFVDIVMAKPTSYVDDKPMGDWGLTRIYLSKDFPDHI